MVYAKEVLARLKECCDEDTHLVIELPDGTYREIAAVHLYDWVELTDGSRVPLVVIKAGAFA